MAMLVAKRGARPSDIKITIRKAQKSITFSTGFFRKHNINVDNTKFLRLGYDDVTKEIGFEFLKSDDKSGEALKIAFSKPGTSGSCPINPIIIQFDVKIDDIAGVYNEKAISGPDKIEGFSKNGFALKIAKRDKK
ncbi:MAG: hypothetical protein H6696_09430 [Deferribacteres bacterium]|nr:hypothetical protein [candidate division KSB1 bacterium]MCB9502148.1 hypothetical protein [Deferribacteres bacterium]